MANPVFDLRSDTVTQPTSAMREAMAQARVGDDCYGDDPTVTELENAVAKRFGKQAGVFVPTGTMANQLAVHTHCEPGQTLVSHPRAHVRIHEDASAARLSGVQIMPIGNRWGYSTEALEQLARQETCGWPPIGLVWVENTLGDAGGAIWPSRPLDEQRPDVSCIESIGAWAREHRRPVHLDGARIWNAHIATGIDLAHLACGVDSISACLSKGLGAPMGSVLCGTSAFVAQARRNKHAFGGSTRQAGIVAAGGLYALNNQLERLADDHRRARHLATAIAQLPLWEVPPPQTNLVVARIADGGSAERVCAPLREAGVLCYPNVYDEVRFVLNLGVDDAALDSVISTIGRVVGNLDGA